MPAVVTRAQAKSLQLLRYFTGSPCKYGHVCERQTNNATCIECRDSSEREYRLANPDRIKKTRHVRYHKNPDRFRAKANEFRKNNKEIVLERERRAVAKVHAKDPGRYLRRAIQWQKDNPDKVRARNARRRARENNAEGKYTVTDLKSLFERQSGKCSYCFVKLGKKYHVDHIVPLVKGGSNWPDNLQLCCRTCNISKGAKDPAEFARYIGRLI